MADLYLHLNGEQKGPYPAEKVRQMLAAGEVTPDTLAWHQGLSAWSNVAALLGPQPGAPLPPIPPVPGGKDMSPWLIVAIAIAGMAVLCLPCCCGVALGPITNGIEKAKESAALQQERAIGIAMFAYANDHDGNFPDAAAAPTAGAVITVGSASQGATTSTEVFQKLLDGKYVADPAIFYIAMPGKVRPAGSVLAANNVSFDVTAGLTSSSPRGIPLIYTTGFKLEFGQRIKISHDGVSPFPPFIAFYSGKNAVTIKFGPEGIIDLTAPFEILGGKYQQLRP